MNTPVPIINPEEFGQACYEGEDELVSEMLAQGADPEGANSDGLFPLERAAVCDHGSTIRLLAAAGAKIDRKDDRGLTSLALASWYGCLDAMKALLDKGADPLALSSDGRLPLHFACSEGLTPEAALLIKHGGFDERAGDDGHTALDLSIRNGSPNCCKALAEQWSLAGLVEHKARWTALLGSEAEAFWQAAVKGSLATNTGSAPRMGKEPVDGLLSLEQPLERKALAAELDAEIFQPDRSTSGPRV